MANFDPSTGPGGRLPDRPIEQLLVMHCLKEDSVLGREGFSVRAASPGAVDRTTLDWAIQFTSYELPLDMKSGRLLGNQAPRRLALVPGPSGRLTLVHTAYLPEDTVGRSHSSVSHILLVPQVSTADAVSAWGSPDWQTDEYPRGETKSLPALDEIPRGSLIDEAMLSAFLSGAAAPADQSLARSVYPVRVESNPEALRRWVRAALHGFLLTADPGSTRARVCILAEPGAVALLVFAIARLLPPPLAGSFLFSTYEPPHTSLRENKVARVIGSYARGGFERGESDALRRKGYVVDTFRDAYGPDLMIDPPWPLEGLLDLAAAGDWSGVDELRALWSSDPRLAHGATPASLGEASRMRPLAAALRAGTIGAEGLIELRRNRTGEGLLRDPERRRRAWEVLRPIWTRPNVRGEFADLLKEHVEELLEEVRRDAQSGPAGSWREGWEVLRPLLPADRQKSSYVALLEQAGKSPSAAATTVEERVAMLREWAQLAPRDAVLPVRLHWLLQVPDPSGFRALARSGIEPRQIGLAACLVLAGTAGRDAGRWLIRELADDPFQAFLEEVASSTDRDAILERIRSSAETVTDLVERLSQAGIRTAPDRIEELLSGVRCDEALGPEFWLEGRRLEGLLDRLPSDSRLSPRLWQGLIGAIAPENFATSSRTGAELETLRAARERYPSSLAPADRDRLDGWIALRSLFLQPPKEAPPAGSASRMRKACEAVGQTREGLARDWFIRRVLAAPDDLERRRRNETLGRVLIGFYEKEKDAWYAAGKLLADANDDEQRRLCEADLENAILSEETRARNLARAAGSSLASAESGTRLHEPTGRGKGRGSPLLDRWKPYVGAFVAGCLVSLLLIVLLWPVLSVAIDSIPALRRPTKPAAKEDGPDKKTIRDLESRLERSRKESADTRASLDAQNGEARKLREQITSLKAQYDSDRAELERLGRELASVREKKGDMTGASPAGGGRHPEPAQSVSRMEGDGTTGGGPIGRSDIDELEKQVLKNPLRPADYPLVLRIAARIEEQKPGTRASSAATSVRHLVSGLKVYDLEIDHLQPVKDKPTNLDSNTDFAFLSGGTGTQPILVTRRQPSKSKTRSNQLSFYMSLRPEGPKAVAKLPGFDFLSAAPSGHSFLLGESDHQPPSPYLVNSGTFYLENKGKADNSKASMNGRKLDLTVEPGTTFALSNDAEMLAVAKLPSQFTGGFSDVSVRDLKKERAQKMSQPTPTPGAATSPGGDARKDDEPNPISFDLSRLGLDSGARVMAMSFDEQGKRLILSFEGQRDLLLLGLGAEKSLPKVIRHTNPIRGWSLGHDGKIAVISDLGVHLFDAPMPGAPEREMPRLLPCKMASHPRCVAFAPKGDTLATGDDGSAVTVRFLTKPFEGQEVLRLAHVGPVMKVGFSPDGRVLAALAKSPSGGDSGAGVIRLWVNERWEP